MITKRQFEKLRKFVRFANGLSTLSNCSRKRTGAIVFPLDFTEVLSIGYNGPATGVPNDKCNGQEGKCGCAHAELNAICKMHTQKTGNVIFTTMQPCVACANAIINCGQISKVIYQEPYRDTSCIMLFEYARIPVIYWSKDYATFCQRWKASSECI